MSLAVIVLLVLAARTGTTTTPYPTTSLGLTQEEFSATLPRMVAATKSIKISGHAYRQLKLASLNSGEPLYKIVNGLLTQEQDTIKALRHAVHRNHNYSPASCDGCGFVQKLVERYIVNGSKAKEKR